MKRVEQVDVDGNIFLDYDTSLSPKALFESISKVFPNIRKDEDGMIIGDACGKRFSIRAKNITYLGHPHPLYKKRIQIADDLQAFYKLSLEKKCTPILLGVYTCGDNSVFCDFNIEDFIKKKAHNSSAHIYSEDLASATTDGYFYKEDYFGNRITAFTSAAVNAFLEEKLGKPSVSLEYDLPVEDSKFENRVADLVLQPLDTKELSNVETIVMNFFNKMKKHWYGIDCYFEMVSADYRNKYQPEWPGFYLEFLFEKYIIDNNLTNTIRYAQDKTKGGIDLDLYMPRLQMYGDLKAHSESSNGIQGNDWQTVMNIISQKNNNHIYYFVGEHGTKKDSDYNFEVTYYWNQMLGKSNLLSYSKRMKNNVDFSRAYILDISSSNKQYLTKFKQGINSNGKPREPKIMIEHDNYSRFLIAEKTL